MTVLLQPTNTSQSYEIMRRYLDSRIDTYEIPNRNELSKIIIGLICVTGEAQLFNGIEPSYSRKNNIWSVGLYLNYDYIISNPPLDELNKYITQSICKRFTELKSYKTLRGIKDRSMLDDIVKLFS